MTVSLVIFDCDGVLIDSEALCDRVVSAALHQAGWSLTPADCHRLFLGLTFPDIQVAAEHQLGRALGADWTERLIGQVTAVMAREVEPIPGALAALEGTTGLGLPFRIASNSTRAEMAAKFSRTGLASMVEGRIHSAYDLIARGKRGKPDPDLFLETAAAEPADPSACIVIEDSLAGVRAAAAAGMRCLAYVPEGDGIALRQAGALPFSSMFALPTLLRGFLTRAS